MLRILSILLTLFISVSLFAQKNAKQENYDSLVIAGIEQMDQQEYESSLENLQKVPEGDSLYLLSQYEQSYLYIKTGEFEKCIAICEFLSKENVTYGHKVYSNWAMALDSLDKDEESLAKFDEGISIFPASYLLHYNKAITLEGLKKYTEAVQEYKEALYYWPNHANSNVRLGILAAKEGEYTKAMLSLMYALIVSEDPDQKTSLVQYIETVADLSLELEPKGIDFGKGDDFSEIDLLIKNRIALNDKFKDKSNINAAFTQQFQLILEALTYNKSDKSFWMQQYIPLFKEISKTDNYAGMIYYCLTDFQNKNIQKIVKKGNSKKDKFLAWAKDNWYIYLKNKYSPFQGKMQDITSYYTGGSLSSRGKENSSGESIGEWEFYHKNGRIGAVGSYNSSGKREGLWKWYHAENGKLKEETTYINGIANGPNIEYSLTGYKASESIQKEGQIEGDFIIYTQYGDTLKVIGVKDKQRNGITKIYHENGALAVQMNLVDGKLDGDYIAYFANDTLQVKIPYKNDLHEGEFFKYYNNGQLKENGTYVDDLIDGPYKSYYYNGQVETEGLYKKNKAIGPWKTYTYQGVLKEEIEYDENGKINATRKLYDTDGKKYLEEVYKNGELLSYMYLDKQGNTIHSDKKASKKIYLKRYNPNGTIALEGELLSDEKNGVWKYYNDRGILESTEEFDNGKQINKEFYYWQYGGIRTEMSYADDKLNGLYLKRHTNDTILNEGYYKDDELNGPWYNYFATGETSETSYYINGEKQIIVVYSCNGKPFTKEYYTDNYITKVIILDTLGNEYQTITDFNGIVEKKHPLNGKVYFKANYSNGMLNGTATWYHGNGKVELTGEYINGDRQGAWKWYNPDGILTTEADYYLGKIHGNIKRYNKSTGKLITVEYYENDEQQGEEINYHPNGKVHSIYNYVNDEIEGEVVFRDETGEIYQIRYYSKGLIIGYSYLDKNGNKLPMTEYSGSGKVTFYYSNGKKSVEWDRLNGKLNGDYIRYDKLGNVIEKDHYEKEKIHGILSLNYTAQAKNYEYYYLYDNAEGVCTYYYENGKKHYESTYHNNNKHGQEKVYNKAGKQILLRQWYNDYLVSETVVK